MKSDNQPYPGRQQRARSHHRRWALAFGLVSVSILLAIRVLDFPSFGLLLIAAFFGLATVISFVLSFFGPEPDGYDLTRSMGQMGHGFARGLHLEETSKRRPSPSEQSDGPP